MSSIRFLLRDIRVTRFWNIWSRNINVGNVVRRCRRDRSVRVVIQCVRQTFLRSRKPILLASAVAAIDAEDDDDGDEDEGDEGNPPCQKNITDEDLQVFLRANSYKQADKVTQYESRSYLYSNNCVGIY